MRSFLSMLGSLFKAHPWLVLLTIIAIVLVLGGAVWWFLGFLISLVRKVPGVGGAVASAADKAVGTVAGATGSA